MQLFNFSIEIKKIIFESRLIEKPSGLIYLTVNFRPIVVVVVVNVRETTRS